ncbi:hypothetical protein KM043_003508 [Ampulex compressa]|nr:hypothetical protein KM043_003508 [Ampulex compressa]
MNCILCGGLPVFPLREGRSLGSLRDRPWIVARSALDPCSIEGSAWIISDQLWIPDARRPRLEAPDYHCSAEPHFFIVLTLRVGQSTLLSYHETRVALASTVRALSMAEGRSTFCRTTGHQFVLHGLRYSSAFGIEAPWRHLVLELARKVWLPWCNFVKFLGFERRSVGGGWDFGGRDPKKPLATGERSKTRPPRIPHSLGARGSANQGPLAVLIRAPNRAYPQDGQLCCSYDYGCAGDLGVVGSQPPPLALPGPLVRGQPGPEGPPLAEGAQKAAVPASARRTSQGRVQHQQQHQQQQQPEASPSTATSTTKTPILEPTRPWTSPRWVSSSSSTSSMEGLDLGTTSGASSDDRDDGGVGGVGGGVGGGGGGDGGGSGDNAVDGYRRRRKNDKAEPSVRDSAT